MIQKIRKAKHYILSDLIPSICCKSAALSSLYYLILDRSFSREHQAVLSGKVKHINEAKKSKANYFQLIRNTHRIEKGLLMKPRRPIFAKNYITETIDSFIGIWDPNQVVINPQMKWFHDVLEEYFISSDNDALLTLEYDRFKKKVNGFIVNEPKKKSIPYYRNNNSLISYEDFFSLTQQRRSVRWFLNKPVPRNLIDSAILAANQAPSACNRQPYEFRVFDDPSMVQKIASIPMGTLGYAHNIPVIVVIVGNLDAYFDERDRHVIYVDASLASMSMMLALETLKLSSCAINWPDIEVKEKEMAAVLGLDLHQRPLMCIGLGYPDPEGMVAYSEKRSIDVIRKYNK